MFFFRHRSLCPGSVPWWNSSNCAPRQHWNVHVDFYHCRDLARTGGWPPVCRCNLFFFRQNPNFSWAAKLQYDVTVRSWGERRTGPSCCPLHVSQRSCSWPRCPGSPRVHVTCSSTAEKRRELKKVACQHWPVSLIDPLIESIVLKGRWLILYHLGLRALVGRSMWCCLFFILLMWEEAEFQKKKKKDACSAAWSDVELIMCE